MPRFWPFLLLVTVACNTDHSKKTNQLPLQIALLPLEFKDSQLLNEVQKQLDSTWHLSCIRLNPAVLPAGAYNPDRKRYYASRLLEYLQQQKPSVATRIIGITDRDMETNIHNKKSWGIMGLAFKPGTVCVVSSYRAKRNCPSRAMLVSRMTELCLHELGHSFNLDHCSFSSCIMQDASGKMKLDASNTFCKQCKNKLLDSKIPFLAQHTENK